MHISDCQEALVRNPEQKLYVPNCSEYHRSQENGQPEPIPNSALNPKGSPFRIAQHPLLYKRQKSIKPKMVQDNHFPIDRIPDCKNSQGRTY